MVSSRKLGERIAQTRRRLGLTQAALAEKLGLSRQTWILLEKGERRPSAEELVRVGEALGTTLHDLVKDHAVEGSVSPRFRLAFERKGAQSAKAVDLLEKLARRYVELERLNGIARVRAPLESLETYRVAGGGVPQARRAAAAAARTVRGALGLGDSPALDVEPGLEAEAGLRIFRLDLPSSLAGIFIWGDEIGGCVGVNRLHPLPRQRWSLLHEAGHFLWDREAGDVLPAAGPDRTDVSEAFADTFAKEFLLPATGVARRFDGIVRANGSRFTVADTVAMARGFDVSFQAMCLRLEELDLLPSGIYERLRKQRFRASETTTEYAHPRGSTPAMLPQRYMELALAAYEAEKISEGTLAEYLMTDRVTARGVHLAHRRLRDGDQEVETDVGFDILSG